MRCRKPVIAVILALASYSSGADMDEVRRWADRCGLGDLKMFVSGGDSRKITVAEPRINGQPWGDPTAAETAMLKRQKSVEQVVRCMAPKAKAAGLRIEYPVTVHY